LADFEGKSFATLKAELLASMADIATQRQKANAEWDEQTNDLQRKLAALEELAAVFGKTSTASPKAANGAEDQPHSAPIQARLRIGDQRYSMLHVARSSDEPVTDEAVARRTGYPVGRVRQQLQADAKLGILSYGEGKYSLTPEGRYLMEQFERSRRSRGQPLPSVDDRDSGVADHDPATSEQGESLA